ncbi:flagellar export chaperone FliS [Domibacillus indicus]|uniref:flagellar export chaperone FliS n=1 Tax=Domibacillus indicus TaxID=1437523 RepID=UPI0006182E37|nr:flagellar export chaperone FliS [Domibacillus indicus]
MITKEMIYQKTPQQITALLYEAGLNQFDRASKCLQEGNFAEANQSMQKINDITERLGAGLNYDAGIIADQLDHVYNFIADTVIEANLYKDAKRLANAQQLFQMIADAWNEAMKNAPQKPISRRKNAYEQSIFIEDQPKNTLEMGK